MKIKYSIIVAGILSLVSVANAGESGSHNHHAAIFTGITVHGSHTDFTMGGDYEYLPQTWNGAFGVIALVDFVFASSVHTVLAAGGTWHPVPALRLLIAPGIEIDHGHTEALLRIGSNYDFHFNQYTVSPAASLDIVDGESVGVFGVAFGMGF